MIQYFRINDPYRLVGLFVLLLIIYAPIFLFGSEMTIPELKSLLVGEKLNEGFSMYSEVVDNTAPLAAWFHELLDTAFGRTLWIRHLIAFFLIFLQAAYLGFVFISKKVFGESTYIPSFLFALLFFFSFDNLTLSSELIGSGFLLLALNNLFQEIEFRSEGEEGIFNIGLCISLASLFTFSFIVYLPCSIAILLLFTRSSVRKFLLLTFGFMLPHLVNLGLAYMRGVLGDVWEFYYVANFLVTRVEFVSIKTLLTLSAVPILYLAFALVMLNREARFSKYQWQILQSMLLWMGFSVFFVMWSGYMRPQSLIVFIPGMSFLLTNFFLHIRRKKFIQMNSWLLVIGILSVSYMGMFGKIGAVDYSRLVVDETENLRGKRILILDNNIDLYANNSMATPFLDWNLAKDIFANPDYYQNVVRVYRSFHRDPPDMVMDRNNVLEGLFYRIPQFRSQYRREGDTYIRITSN